MAEIVTIFNPNPNIVKLGSVSFRIVTNVSHILGRVAVRHNTSTGVKLYQVLPDADPEKIQLKCMFIGRDKSLQKARLELIHKLRIPIPFVSGLTIIPLVTIESLVFTQTVDRKDLSDNQLVIDFIITLSEFKRNILSTIIGKVPWLIWTSATQNDPASGLKLLPSPPSADEQAAEITTDIIYANAIDNYTVVDIDEITGLEITNSELNALNLLNKKFDRLPFEPTDPFPRTIKLNYPPSSTHYLNFNNVANLPNYYDDLSESGDVYKFPVFNPRHSDVLTITVSPRETNTGIYVVFTVIDSSGNTLFSRKIITDVIYIIGNYEFIFNEIDIKKENLQPETTINTDFGTRFEGGLRVR